MSSSGTANQEELRVSEPSPAAFPWAAIAWFSALLFLLYASVIIPMVKEWFTNEDMGHGIFVPFVSAWLIWNKRKELAGQPVKPNPWGFLVVVWGFLQLIVATFGAEFFLARSALVISLFGIVWTVCGNAVVRTLAFPLFLLLFMVRWPTILYNQITFPLQLFASRVSEAALMLLGIPVVRDGNVLELASRRLSVVEACSGIRSLLSLTFLSLVYAHLFDGKKWMTWVLLGATIPIAITANAFRVTMTGILTEYKPELAEGFFHSVEGWVIFMIALIALVLVHRFVNAVYSFLHARS